MKKKLFFAAALIVTFSVSAQVLESDNFNSYTLGNVSSAVNSIGQGGMYFIMGNAPDYQIIAGGAAHGNYLQIIGGSDATAASYRLLSKNGLGAAWAARITGNNIVKGVLDIYTGTATNQHYSGMSLLDSNSNPIVGAVYDSQTRTISCNVRLKEVSSSQDKNYIITIQGSPVFPPNTWVTVGYSYNKTTGEARLQIGNSSYTINVAGCTPIAGQDPRWSSMRDVQIGTGNAGPTTFGIDNYRIEASNNTVLGTSETKVSNASLIAIGPNPTTDYLNILTDLKINRAEIFDMSGKKIDMHLDGNKIDVKNLNPGIYIINVETKEGKTTTKFIKK